MFILLRSWFISNGSSKFCAYHRHRWPALSLYWKHHIFGEGEPCPSAWVKLIGYLHEKWGPIAEPLSVSVLHLMTRGTHAIQSLMPKCLPCPQHGEPHCDSMSQNSVVVLWALGTGRLHRFWSCRVCACGKKFSRQQAYSFYSFQQEFLTKDPFGGYNLQKNLELQIGLQLWPPLILGLMCAHMCTFTFLSLSFFFFLLLFPKNSP